MFDPSKFPPDKWEDMSLWEQLALMAPDEQEEMLRDLIRRGIDLESPEILYRRKQKEIIDSEERVILYAGGRGTGKTFIGAGWVNDKAAKHPGCIIHLVGRTVADVRDVMVAGESGILAHAPKDFVPTYTPSARKLVWPNGSKAITFSADAPDQLRGPQSHFTWADELAAYPQKPDASGATTWDNIEFSTRLGENPQILATTTPKRVPVMRELFARAAAGQNTFLVQGSSWENRSNLSKDYMEYIFNRFAGTHLERQELYGELIGDSPGALWNSEDFVYKPVPKGVELIYVIGVDPAVTFGIVVMCSDTNPDPYKRQAWVLEDLTMNAPVEQWGAKVVELQKEYSQVSDTNPRGTPAIVVVEKNQGHDLLKVLFKSEGMSESAPVVDVSAKASKSQRAEPVVMAYRQKRVFHAEDLPLLVDELTSWEPGVTKYSPGRLDALVWGLAVLLVDPRPIARWAPILLSKDNDFSRQTLGGVRPAWKQGRGVNTGIGTAPWRRGR
jgi:phage terminase large subunit-like protein